MSNDQDSLNLKETLNLPFTEFPMKAGLAQREPEMLARWQKLDIYQRIADKNIGKTKFILHDGPPYANGELHLGHAINKSLKDFVVKAKSMSGFDAPYIPGWDCHGLPIEHNVEKKKGKAGVKISHADFRTACREYAAKQVEIQKRDFIRLGVFGDWENPYLTMNFSTEANIVRALGKIAGNGHLVKGYKPVYWSVVGASALAEAEVEYQDKQSFAIDVRFSVVDRAGVLALFGAAEAQGDLSVVIWTTTPWTLPANQAVSLNAELDYALVRCDLGAGEELLVLAKDMIDGIMARYGCSEFEELGSVTGEALDKQALNHPFAGREVPIILGDHVTTDAGTGAVHTAPDHGVDDFNVGRANGIGTLNLVDENGVYTSGAGEFAGQHVYKVDEAIIAKLDEANALVRRETITHSYAHCWRTKTPLIYRATPQWFVSMDQKGLRAQSLKEIKGVQWIPDWGQARIESMVANRPDWCISRQRTWGVPITLFIHKVTGEIHPNTLALMASVAELIEQGGIDAWFDLDPAELLQADADQYEKVTDTLDVWFDSGVTHDCVLRQRDTLDWPADLYLEGSDQHRGWFQSSLLTGVAIHQGAPYRSVLTHGFTVDGDGRKMSKSLGNIIPAGKAMQELGADVLRLWVSAADYRNEISASDEIFKRTADAYRRIRNTARFLLANLAGFDPERDCLPTEQLLPLDRWILEQAHELQAEICSAYEQYQFHHVYHKVHNFCSGELGGFYLDIIKDQFYILYTICINCYSNLFIFSK